MSRLNGIRSRRDQFSFLLHLARTSIIRHPEWWTWLLSIYVWVWLIGSAFVFSTEVNHSGAVIYCLTDVSQVGEIELLQHGGILKELTAFSKFALALSNGIVPWIIMIVAMMFPLLNEAIRHMAFSVKQSDRDLGIVSFLVGYALIWAIVGVVFLCIPLFLDLTLGTRSPIVDTVLAALVFMVTAIVIWLPGRSTTMARCAQTMPIRISGIFPYLDGIRYGAWMGIACVRMCWLPMTALMLAHHSVYLMLIVTIVVIIERYYVPHTNKLPSYAFGVIALSMLTYGLYLYL